MTNHSKRRRSRAATEDSDFSETTKERRRWKAVLNEVYRLSPHGYGIGKEGLTDTHPLAKKLKVSGQEIMLSLSFLESNGLIKYGDHNWIELTDKGFGVALENEKSGNNARLQAMAIFVSLILAATAIFSFVNSTHLIEPLILLVAYQVTLVVMYLYAFRIFSR